MNSKELEFFKQLLLEKRIELLGEMNSIKTEEEEMSLKEEDGDHSAYPFHLADQGSDSMAQELNFFYAHRDSRLLYHIDQALDKIKNGKYGRCETCNQLINRDRLEALPHARLCIECKLKEEGLDDKTDDFKDRDLSVPEETYEDTY